MAIEIFPGTLKSRLFPAIAAGIGKASASGSSGATVDTSSRPGKTIYKFSGSGEITITQAGYAEILCIAGGGGGGSGDNAYGFGGGGGGSGRIDIEYWA